MAANKKALKAKMLTKLDGAAKKSAQFGADNLCIWWEYQPKKPKAVKKMRKF